ncbi:hypothetical protein TrLO_g11802 [Triparma laevis f. longispina]|uniref:Uncharacterized protein n=1 Tax=Triparma laevis f. longispina TaxID=1714387 RepID=A0A9W7CAS8_9STRA|nr:hypothetical protein TrLO_g11802 [Triparma laevis f. longispina]
MSKSVESESNDCCETSKASRKRGGEDEEKEDGYGKIEGAMANSTITTTVSAAPATSNQFMHTPEFRRHFIDFVQCANVDGIEVYD